MNRRNWLSAIIAAVASLFVKRKAVANPWAIPASQKACLFKGSHDGRIISTDWEGGIIPASSDTIRIVQTDTPMIFDGPDR